MVNSYGYTFRKDGHTRIVEYDLPRKQKALMQLLGKVRPNVLLLQRRAAQNPGPVPYISDYANGDVEMEDVEDEPEPPGESTMDGGDDQAALPRAVTGAVKTIRGRNERVVPPEEARAHLRRLFAREPEMTTLVFGRHGPFARGTRKRAEADMFFLDVLPVPPTRFRPPAKMGDSVFEHPQNELLTKVLVTTYRLRDLEEALREANAKPAEAPEVSPLLPFIIIGVKYSTWILIGRSPRGCSSWHTTKNIRTTA